MRTLPFLGCLFLLTIPGWSQSLDEAPEAELKELEMLLLEGDTDRAFEAVTDWLALHPDKQAGRFLLAQCLEARGDSEAALEIYREFDAAAAKPPGLSIRLARLLTFLDKHEEAHALLDRETQENPKNARAWSAMALNHLDSGKTRLAEITFAHAKILDPKIALEHSHEAGRFGEKWGQPLRAISEYQAVITLAPENPEPWLGLAQSYETIGIDVWAKDSLNRCRELDVDNALGEKIDLATAHLAPFVADQVAPPAEPTIQYVLPPRELFELPELPVTELVVPPPVEFDQLDRAQWAGCVSATREAMRLIYGQMSPQEVAKFEDQWLAPLLHPNPEIVEYFNKLNPLLARFLALRHASVATLLEMDRVQFEAVNNAAGGDGLAYALAMRGYAHLHAHLKSLQQALTAVVEEIAALGPMPDAAAAMAEAQRRHREAFSLFAVGSGLEGEWVGTCTHQEIDNDLDGSDAVANVIGSILSAHKEGIRDDLSAEELAKEKEKQAAWGSGEPIPENLIERFEEHIMFTAAENADGTEVYQSCNLKPIPDLKREEYVASDRLESYETDRVTCDRWMDLANFLWPSFDEGTNYWSLEQLSRNPSDWLQRWEWEFDLEGDTLTITEKGHYSKQHRSLLGAPEKDLAGKLRQHRIWKLRRVARSKSPPPQEAHKLALALQSVAVPSTAWVLKQSRVVPPARPLAKGVGIDVAKDGLSVTVTFEEKLPLPPPEGEGAGVITLSPTDEEVIPHAGFKIIKYQSVHRISKAPPARLRPGDTFETEVSVAITPPKDRGSHDFHLVETCFNDGFTLDGFAHKTTKVEADEDKLSSAIKHKSDPVMDIPFDRGRTTIIRFSGEQEPHPFSIDYTYLAVPLEAADQVESTTTVTGAGGQGEAAPETAARKAQIAFHHVNIKYFEREIDRLTRDATSARDPEGAEELKRRLLYAKDAKQRELDQIRYIETGEYRHTRTEADEFNQKLMDQQSREMAAPFEGFHRLRDRGYRLVAAAPREKRAALRARIERALKEGTLAGRQSGPLRDEIESIFAEIRSEGEREAKDELWRGEAADWGLWGAEKVKGGSEIALMVLAPIAIGPGMALTAAAAEGTIAAKGLAIYAGYSAFTTGYMEGDPVRACRQVLAGITMTGGLADTAMEAYKNGVVGAYDEYAQNMIRAHTPAPTTDSSGKKIPPIVVKPVDEFSAGMTQVGWEGAKMLALMGAAKLGTYWFFGSPPTRPKFKIEGGRSAEDFSKRAKKLWDKGTTVDGWMTLDDFSRLQSFRVAQRSGREAATHFDALARQHSALRAQLRAAGASLDDLASNMRLRLLQRRMLGAYGKVKVNYQAKMYLNQSGNRAALTRYNQVDTMQMGKVRNRLGERMQGDGFSRQRYDSFSNSASSGKAGMDVDIGVVEKARPPTRPPTNASERQAWQTAWNDYLEWKRGLTITKNGVTRRAGMHEFSQAGNRNLRMAFHEVVGENLDDPFLQFTHSMHPEAYKEGVGKWLGSKNVKHVVVDAINPGWTQQAASVTRFKVDELAHFDGLDHYSQLQEMCRGLNKDIKTKLNPLLPGQGNAKPPSFLANSGKTARAAEHFEELNEIMRRFANNEIGPVEADRQIRILTGGRGLPEVAERFRVMLEALAGPSAR